MNEIELIYKPHTSFCLDEVEEKVIEILEEKEVTATSISSSSTCSSNCSTNKQTLSLDSSNMSSCCSSYHRILTCPTHDTDCSSESSVSENDYQYTKWKSKLMNRSPSPLRHDSKNINISDDDDDDKSIRNNGTHSSSSSSSSSDIQAQVFRKHTILNASDDNNTSYMHHNVNTPIHSTLSTHVDLSVITDTLSSFQNDENIETPKIKNHTRNKSLTSTLQTPCTSNVLQHDIDNSVSLSSLEVKETTIIPSPIHTVCTESTSLMSSPMSSCTYISTGNHQSFKQQNPSAPLLRPSGVVRAPSSSSVRFMDVKPSTEDNLAQAKALLDYARDLRKKLQKQ